MTTPIIARVPQVDAATLCRIAADVVGTPCCTFGGSVLWDLDQKNKANNLRSIKEVQDFSTEHVRGDFGHAFNDRAEVRWKRIDQDIYDVLILGEKADLALPHGAYPILEEVAEKVQVRDPNEHGPKEKVAISLDGADHDGRQLKYVEYLAPNGAVLFVRYCGFLKENQR